MKQIESAGAIQVQASLLDRLTEEDHGMSLRRYKQSVIRDLQWLFNAGSMETAEDLKSYPTVQRSAVNFGMRDLAGTMLGNADAVRLEEVMRRAILDFEPRIIPTSLRIRVMVDPESMHTNAITFEILAELWWQPVPERLYVRTILDLELGEFEVQALEGA